MVEQVETIEPGREIEVDLVELVSVSMIRDKLTKSYTISAKYLRDDFNNKLAILDEVIDYLELFPEDETTIVIRSYEVSILFHNDNIKTARKQRSQVQQILNVIAKRELDYSGSVQWKFVRKLQSGNRIEVTIPNGTLAPNCRLESKVTRPRQVAWKIVCDDESKSLTTTRALKGK